MTGTLRSFVGALWREHRRALLVVGAASVALTLTEGIGLLMLVPMLRLVGVALGDGASDRIAGLMDAMLRAVGVTPTLEAVLTTVVALVSLRAALQYVRSRWEARLEVEVVGSLRNRLFEAVVETPWARFAGERPAVLVHTLGPQVDDVHSALLSLLQAVAHSAAVLSAAVVAFAVSPLLSAVVVIAGSALFALARALRAPGREDGDRLLAASEGWFARLSELLGGMKMIHAHGAERRAMSAVSADTRRWSSLMLGFAERRARVALALAVLGVLMLAGLVWVSVSQVRLAPATLLLLLLLYARLVPRIADLQVLASDVAQLLASYASVTALLERCDAVHVSEATDALDASVARDRPRRAPEIVVRDITVRYPGSARPALEGMSATVTAGTLSAVVGASGVGKTTLGDVLLGLLAPERGDVLVDGAPLSALPRARWRQRVGYLAQEPMLFHGTISENLRFAAPHASEADLAAALRSAACDFVERLPQGIESPVGDRGVLLSGGERQRIALARALLRQPDLLVLDEATSALDAETEAHILQSLRALRGQCTVVFCTHRRAVREAADQVIAL